MKTIFGKSLILLTALVLGISICFTTVVLFFMNALYYETNSRSLENSARIMLSLAENEFVFWFLDGDNSKNTKLSKLLEDLPDDIPYRITLINREGRVVADSRGEADGFENHRYRPEVEAALNGNVLTVRRISRSLYEQHIYTAVPIFSPAASSEAAIGVFRLSLTIPSFWARIIPGALPFMITALILAAAAITAVCFFAHNLSLPVKQLVAIAAEAEQEKFDPQQLSPPVVSDIEEFRNLDNALRAMAAELRRRLEKAETQRLRLETILNGITEAVFAMDETLKLRLINPAARKLFEIEDSISHPSLLEASRSSALEECARQALGAEKAIESELIIHQSSGSKYFQVFTAPLCSVKGKGTTEGLVMVLSDVTRLRQLETVRKDFVANVSHELRTPIQLVKGFSENLLETDFSDMNKTRHFIEIIHRNAGRMEDLTHDLMLLMNLEADNSPALSFEETFVISLLTEAIDTAHSSAEKKNISISVSCQDDLSARLHSSFLVQAVFNLIDNAIKYSPENTQVHVRAVKKEKELLIEVADEGPGIALEHLERIFERFYRVDGSRSREAGGTGLGLSIVRHIALLHGGTVEAQSHAGEGSIFRIRLPAT